MSGVLASFVGATYGGVELVKTATFTNDEGSFSTTLSQSGMRAGDTVVLSLSSNRDRRSSSLTALGGDLTWDIYNNNFDKNPGWLFANAVWDGTGSDPLTISATAGESDDWSALAGVVAVFRGVSTRDRERQASGPTGMPNPTRFVASVSGSLMVVCGSMGASVTMTAPSGMTLAATETHTFNSLSSATGIAFITPAPFEYDPAAFGGGASAEWGTVTFLFDEDP